VGHRSGGQRTVDLAVVLRGARVGGHRPSAARGGAVRPVGAGGPQPWRPHRTV